MFFRSTVTTQEKYSVLPLQLARFWAAINIVNFYDTPESEVPTIFVTGPRSEISTACIMYYISIQCWYKFLFKTAVVFKLQLLSKRLPFELE